MLLSLPDAGLTSGALGIYFPIQARGLIRVTDKIASDEVAQDPSVRIKGALLSAFRKLFRPLVRILIRHGVSFPEFSDIAKVVYVEAALHDFPLDEKKVSGSRIAILTGLTRKDVKRLLEAVRQPADIHPGMVSSSMSRAGRVLAGWFQDPDFLATHYGIPRDLPFDSEDGVSFVELVKRYSGDMPARAMLEELLRVGAVQKTEDNLLHVTTRSYIPSPLNLDSIARIGITLHDLASTLDFNLNPNRTGKPRFERRVTSDDGIAKADIEAFHALVREKGQQLLESLDNWLAARQQQPDGSAPRGNETRTRIGVGVYLFQQDTDQ